jgi:hypothetical protein
MNVLLARNGKPSNLTPEQYKLVREPAFKKWFGDWENSPTTSSKVVDENGEPKVVARMDYERKYKYADEYPIFFCEKEDVKYFTEFGEKEIYVFLNIKNPIIIQFGQSWDNVPYDELMKVFSEQDLTDMINYEWNENYKSWGEYLNSLDDSEQFLFSTDIISGHVKNKGLNDGVIIYDIDETSNHDVNTNDFIAFNSNQIKLADGTNTTFDSNNPDIRYKKGGEIKDLVVLHNINDYQIEEANKIGGLITPSIAIVKSGNSFTDFGSITLIGTKELIDPENRSVKVFAGDVYSPSVPRKLWYVDKRTLEKATTELIKKSIYYDNNISKSNREIYHLVNQYIGNSSNFDTDIEKNSFNRLIEEYFEKLKLIYIVDKSIKIKVPFKDKRHFLWNNVEFKLTEEQKKRFAPILREYTNESNEKGSNGTSKEIQSKVYDLFLEVLNNIKLKLKEEYKANKDGDKLYEMISNKMFESFEKTVGKRYNWSGYTEHNLSRAVWSEKELDKEKLNQTIKKVFTKDVIEDYKKWLSDFISQFQGSSYFLKGNEKMPYTLNYLVDATSNRVVGQEKNMTFSVNQAKSFGTKRLNSINEIKKNSNKLISKEEMNLIDEKNSDNFSLLSKSLKYQDENTWRKLDSLGKALADYFKGSSIVSALRKNDFSSPTSYQIDLFKDFADELKNSPVDYFEAKYQRAVLLSEFKYAVVPKNTSKEVLQILLDNGIIIKKYESEEQRLQIINTISNKDKSIKFEEGGDVWDADRYRQIEKEMYELSNQGKTDSAEYFKLIKERSILEKNKMETQNKSEENMDNYSMDKFAKGGKILIKQITNNGNTINVHKDFEKFKRIGIEDKYFIEASNDIGLQGVVFSKETLSKKITAYFNNLLENYTDYIISEDSDGITFFIENNIKELQRGGNSLEVIQNERDKLTNEFERLKIIQDFAKTQREALDKWIDYLGQSDYSQAFLYLILKAVLNYNYDLKLNKLFERTNETTRNITPFDAGTLSDLFYSNSNYLLQDYAQLMSENSQKILNSKEIIDETESGKWIKFNGGSKTPPSDIEKNGKELMQLVQNTYWCTKNGGGEQLKGGDFYVYVTESGGEVFPQIAVRMNEQEVGEIRGNESSSQDLSAESLPIARNFLTKNIPNNSGKKWLDSIEYNERCVEMGNRFQQEGLYENFITDYLELLSQKSKYKVDYGENGNVVGMVAKFEEAKEKLPNQYFERGDIETYYSSISPMTKYFMGNLNRYEMQTLASQNIDLSDLTDWKLKLVSGSFDCSDIVTNLGNIEFVGNDLTLSSNTTDFGSVKHIGGRFDMGSAQIETLGNIESIGVGFVVNSNLKDLGKLKKIGWLMILSCDSEFTLGDLEEVTGDLTIKVSDTNFDVGNLKIVGGSFDAGKTLLTDLKGLESVGQDFNIAGSKIKIFENLKTIGGNADFSNNFSTSTQNIESILGSVKLLNSRIVEFTKLNVIGGSIELRGSYLKSFGNIKTIGTNLDLVEGKIEDLGNLEEINGFANFKGSQVKSLNKLKKIVSFANFSDSLVEDLGNLESIGGNAYFNDTKIKSIGKLKYIGGFTQFYNNEELENQWEKVKNAE